MSANPAVTAWQSLVDDEVVLARLESLWGKSDARGLPLPLLQHLFDAMAVAELVWDNIVAPCLRDRIDDAAGRRGRAFYVWLCGLHDCGKASVAFASKDERCWDVVRQSGLPAPQLTPLDRGRWRHEMATARILIDVLGKHWRDRDAVAWVWPILAGHHGVFHGLENLNPRGRDRARLHGDESWGAVQEAIVDVATRLAGYPDIAAVEPRGRLSRPDQLALSGFVVVADWIASIGNRFRGMADFGETDFGEARRRAREAWAALGLRGGWGRLSEPAADPVRRFESVQEPRPVQRHVVEAARKIAAPGLIIVEAPTGEGKTEAAHAAAEVLASRFGADGVFDGLPTQATSDPMFDRVAEWLATFDDCLPVALLHGRRIFHDRWRRLTSRSRGERFGDEAVVPETDEYGMAEELPSFAGLAEDHTDEADELGLTVVEWMLGRHRGLLSPNVVGTIDQLLYAGTCTRYVMLRYAGLAGKVVILDEVHAVDDYMAVYLTEVLEWLGQGQVPVVLLSATLSPAQRERLVGSYLNGALGRGYRDLGDELKTLHGLPGYPAVVTACVVAGNVCIETSSVESSRPTETVTVEILDEPEGDDAAAAAGVADLLSRELAEGGCALVVHNTVARAQATYEAVRSAIGDEVVLLHSRLSAADRAERTQQLVKRLGPGGTRPQWEHGERLVIVATQVAEQSFDVDVDLLVSDHAPVDLLLQRAGRMHRHRRPDEARPPRLRRPRMVVTGVIRRGEQPPGFPGGSEAIYGRHLPLRSWVLVEDGAKRGWPLPASTPELVARAYGTEPIVPELWADDARAARHKWDEDREASRRRAQALVLTRTGESSAVTLEGLNVMGTRDADVEKVRVRDGDDSEEVVLIRGDERGLWTLDGRTWLGQHGEVAHGHVDDDLVVAILGGTVRVPVGGRRRGALSGVGPLPEWRDHPVLGRQKVVCLDAGHRADLPGGRWSLGYDAELGLWMEEHR